jgi:DNA processing protein
VSGGAVGIDAAAHRGALDAGGVTVAVLGSGIDVAHPARNGACSSGSKRREPSSASIRRHPAEPFRFPARNRLIAALSRGVVVVEGAAKSGTRITAEHAVDLGLDVFAVPGPVTSPLAETPLGLIRDGAIMIRGTPDLLEDLGLDGEASGKPGSPPGGCRPTSAGSLRRWYFDAADRRRAGRGDAGRRRPHRLDRARSSAGSSAASAADSSGP